MKPSARLLRVAFLVFCLLGLLSCGGDPSPSKPPADPVVTVSLTEHYSTVSGGETHQFAATVTGSSNTSVSWSLSACTGDTCGSISPSGLYTAPMVVSVQRSVMVTATAQANPDKLDQATIMLMPIGVKISPVGAWVAPSGTQVFTASVLYDSRNAGVSWAFGSACSDTCGTLSNVATTSVTYTAPATAFGSSLIRLTASSVSDPTKKAEITIAPAGSGGMTEGDYAFVFNGWQTPTSNGTYWMYESIAAGRFHADAQGNITEGVEDINSLSGVFKALPFTGNYMIGADGRGSLTLISGQGSATYRMVLDASRKSGKFLRFDALNPNSLIFGSGYFEMQDKTAFSLSALTGPYAFGLFGSLDANRQAAVGRFDADASGGFAGGSSDVSRQVYIGAAPQVSSTNLNLTGSLGAPSATTGRGTATLNWGSAYQFAYYVISDQKILLVQIDARNSTTPVLSGTVRRQTGPFSTASFNAPAIFSMAGVNRSNYGVSIENAAVGQIVPGASGSLTGVIDDNQGLPEQPFTGSYTVAPSGRSELLLKPAANFTNSHVAYFYSPNEAFLMQTSGTDVLFGRLRPQAAGPFSEASLTGTYLTHTSPPASEQVENDCGLTTFDGSGGITSTVEVNRFGDPSHLDFDGTYTVAPNGRGTLIFSSPATGSAVFWVVSPTELVSVGAVTTDRNFWGTLLEYER
jgi:hypothetical protein